MFLDKRKLIIGGIIIALSAILYCYAPWESDVDVIDFLLCDLEEVLSKDEGEGGSLLAAAGSGSDVAEFCAEGASMEILPGRKFKNKAKLAGFIGKARTLVNSATVVLRERAITVDESGKSAIVLLRGIVKASYHEQTYRSDRRYKMTWVKCDGDWLIQETIIIRK